MTRLFRRFLVAFTFGLSLPVLAADTIQAQSAWTRATPPGAANSASYVQLHNAGDEMRSVIAAHSSVADEIQLHTVLSENGLMKMRQVPFIEIPAGGMTELKPGGFHIMMLGIKQPLKEGESVQIELEFANGDKLNFESPIQKMAAGMDHSKMDHSKMKHD